MKIFLVVLEWENRYNITLRRHIVYKKSEFDAKETIKNKYHFGSNPPNRIAVHNITDECKYGFEI